MAFSIDELIEMNRLDDELALELMHSINFIDVDRLPRPLYEEDGETFSTAIIESMRPYLAYCLFDAGDHCYCYPADEIEYRGSVSKQDDELLGVVFM